MTYLYVPYALDIIATTMNPCRLLAVSLLVVVAVEISPINAFSTQHLTVTSLQGQRITTRRQRVCLAETTSDVVPEEDTTSQEGKSMLKFGGALEAQTSPLPAPSKEQVLEFFTDPSHRNLFFTAGGAREVTPFTMDSETLDQWTAKCQTQESAVPDASDEVFSVQTAGIHFPGIHVQASAVLGVKFVEEPQLSYEVSMVRDSVSVTGLPPIVWVFNKLIGGSDENKASNLSLTTIFFEFDPNNETVIFKTESSLTIMVKFPSVLLKILPTNKEKAEEQGGKSAVKTLEKDVHSSIEAYEKAYLDFLETL